MKLTRNFWLKEFTHLNEGQLGSLRISLVGLMAENLQHVRNWLNTHPEWAENPKREIGIGIVSGLRSKTDYERLLREGYHPSRTSDHFYGQLPEPYLWQARFPVGASDINLSNCKLTLYEVFERLVDEIENGNCKELKSLQGAQVIYEKHNTAWIHISNSPNQVLLPPFSESRKSTNRYLTTFNGGKSYESYFGYIKK